jgi:hypothetical protein
MQSAEIITAFSLREKSRRKMVHTPIFRCQFFKFSFYKTVITSNTFHPKGKYWTGDIPSTADRKMTSLRRSHLMNRPCQSFVLDEENNDVETAIGYDCHLKQRMPLYIEANRRIVTYEGQPVAVVCKIVLGLTDVLFFLFCHYLNYEKGTDNDTG